MFTNHISLHLLKILLNIEQDSENEINMKLTIWKENDQLIQSCVDSNI